MIKRQNHDEELVFQLLKNKRDGKHGKTKRKCTRHAVQTLEAFRSLPEVEFQGNMVVFYQNTHTQEHQTFKKVFNRKQKVTA